MYVFVKKNVFKSMKSLGTFDSLYEDILFRTLCFAVQMLLSGVGKVQQGCQGEQDGNNINGQRLLMGI